MLDAGCGMGRWLHFARAAGAEIVGMDVSAAIDVAAAREGDGADFVQADLRFPPFAPESFDLVYSLGVVHHLEEPMAGVRALAKLVRPGGELRLYVYRTLEDEPWWKRLLLRCRDGAAPGHDEAALPGGACRLLAGGGRSHRALPLAAPDLEAMGVGRSPDARPASRPLRGRALPNGRVGAVRPPGGTDRGALPQGARSRAGCATWASTSWQYSRDSDGARLGGAPR